MYKLKWNSPDLEVMDGPDKGKRFVSGGVYAQVPESIKDQFEIITESAAENAPRPARRNKQ